MSCRDLRANDIQQLPSSISELITMHEDSVRTRPFVLREGGSEVVAVPLYCSDLTANHIVKYGPGVGGGCEEKCKPCLSANPWAEGTSYTKLEGVACSDSFFEREPGICTFCTSEDPAALVGASIGVTVALTIFCAVLFSLANAHWEPDARDDVHAVVHFGECQSARSIAATWRSLIVQRFQFQPNGVQLAHTDTALEVGDRVLVPQEVVREAKKNKKKKHKQKQKKKSKTENEQTGKHDRLGTVVKPVGASDHGLRGILRTSIVISLLLWAPSYYALGGSAEGQCSVDPDPCLYQPGTVCVTCETTIRCEIGSFGCPYGFKPNENCRRGYSCDEVGTGSAGGLKSEEMHEVLNIRGAEGYALSFGLPFLPGFIVGLVCATANLRLQRKKQDGKVTVKFEGKTKEWLLPPDDLIFQPFVPQRAAETPA